MAESELPFATGPVPQPSPQDGSTTSHHQGRSLGPSFNSNPQYSLPHHAFAPQFVYPHPLTYGQHFDPSQYTHYQHTYPVGSYSGAGFGNSPGSTVQHNAAGNHAILPPHDYRHEANTYAGFAEQRDSDETFNHQSMLESHYPGLNDQSFVALSGPSNPQWAQQPAHFLSRRPRPVSFMGAISSNPHIAEAALNEFSSLRNIQGEPHIGGSAFGRRIAYQRPSAQHVPDTSNQERRHAFRSDDAIQPPNAVPLSRQSNRRSFDRYSIDLPNGALEANGSTRSPASRAAERMARRQRPVPIPGSFRRLSGHTDHHPNIPSAEQMQKLRDKLRHLLPKDLPEGTDPTCDICQKDYSTKHIDPSEDNEVAIQLPCKHVFGEHCMNTWFETCKKHKNKITCPTCRKVLIEPKQRPVAQSPRQLLERLEWLQREEGGGRYLWESMPSPAREHLLGMMRSSRADETVAHDAA